MHLPDAVTQNKEDKEKGTRTVNDEIKGNR